MQKQDLDGVWRLVESRAWNENGDALDPPYGSHPIGQITFQNGRMLAALCNGDEHVEKPELRGFSSYGGFYTLTGASLVCHVDMASDPTRIGGQQNRVVAMLGLNRMMLLPPPRLYGGRVEKRELIWERVWPLEG